MDTEDYDDKEDPLDCCCRGYVLWNVGTEEELLAYYDNIKCEHPDQHPIIVLDDVSQACYPSGHCIHKYRLESNEHEEVSGLSASIRFRTRLQNLTKGASGLLLEDLEAG